MFRSFRFALALGLVIFNGPIFAQEAVREKGPVVPGNLPVWTQDRIIGDSGIATSSLTPGGPVVPTNPGLNVYVAKTGSDATTNNCQVQVTPCLTIKNAITQGAKYDILNGSLLVNIAAGTYNETIAIGGKLRSSMQVGCCDTARVELIGAGSSQTFINGTTETCGTIVPSWDAYISIQSLTVLGTGTACQSTLFAQLGGKISVLQDVAFGAANQSHMHVEGAGSKIEIWNDYTISGGAGSHIGVSNGNGIVEYNGTINVVISGAPTFTGPEFMFVQHGATVFLANTTFIGFPSGTCIPYIVESMGYIVTNQTNNSPIPGCTGGQPRGQILTGGEIWPESVLIPSANLNALSSITGLGTGTATISQDSSANFYLTLAPAGTPGASGSAVVTFQARRTYPSNNSIACSLTPVNGSASWDDGATVTWGGSLNTAGNPPTGGIHWKNAGIALTAGQTYSIAVNCGNM